jgi:hypothetical protein
MAAAPASPGGRMALLVAPLLITPAVGSKHPLSVVQAAGPVPSLKAVGTGPLLSTTFNAEADCLYSGRRRVHRVHTPHLAQAGASLAYLRVQNFHRLEGGGETEIPQVVSFLLQVIQ